MSAETHVSFKELQSGLALHVDRAVRDSHKETIMRLGKAMELSQHTIISHIEQRLKPLLSSTTHTRKYAEKPDSSAGAVSISRPKSDSEALAALET